MAKTADPEINAKRQSAVYIAESNRLFRSNEKITEAEVDKLALAAVEAAVFGHDARRDKKGKVMQQGIGAPGHETANHFAAIRKYEGKEAWEAAVREIQERDPKKHAELGLPKLPEKPA